MFFVIVSSILVADILWWIWAHLRLRHVRRRRMWRSLLAGFMALQFGYILFMFLAPGSARHSQSSFPVPLVAMVYVWHLLILPITVALLLVSGTIRLPIALVRRAQEEPPDAQQPLVAEQAPSRRELLRVASVALPPLLTFAAAGRGMLQLGDLRVREMHLSLPTLPAALEGLTIAHISDLHVGRWTRGSALANVIEASNRLRPDLVLMTGDLIDLSLADLPRALEAMGRLDSRYGVYMCEGNHDLIENRFVFERDVKQSDVPLLLDEAQTIDIRGEPLQLLGLRWGRGEDAIIDSSQRLMSMMRFDMFRILLAHHPHAFDHTLAPLTLAGHTHGGQLMLNERMGAGPVMFRYWSGHYHREARSLVVSNGAGNWFPLRVNAPAEIVHITLHRA